MIFGGVCYCIFGLETKKGPGEISRLALFVGLEPLPFARPLDKLTTQLRTWLRTQFQPTRDACQATLQQPYSIGEPA
jgi:hypothetical protein